MPLKLTFTEENYLKTIYSLGVSGNKGVTTNAIAGRLQTKAASVTDMIKKLSDKKLLNYEKYYGVTLTKEGKRIAIETIRKHRLWEVFLVEKLNFGWDEVHEVAEQLEHIQSVKLIDKLDEFLDHPETDPHGDPIPDKNGKMSAAAETTELSACGINDRVVIHGVADTSSGFLVYLNQQGLILGVQMKVISVYDFDKSMVVELKNKMRITVSNMVTRNIMVKKL
ncbi:MAG: metal-dependent transcriptional regulator [Bacteroidota bacterium]